MLIAATASSLVGCAATGASHKTVPSPFGGTDTIVQMGQTMSDTSEHSVRVLNFQKTGSLPNGSQCLQVSVSVTNEAPTAWPGPLSNLRISDSQGYWHYGATPCGVDSPIWSLDAGQSATAIVYFDVYANTALELTWTPDPAKPTVTCSTELQ